MTASVSGGPFISRRGSRPASAWRKPGHGMPRLAEPSPSPANPASADRGGVTLIEACLALMTFALVIAGSLYAYSSMKVQADGAQSRAAAVQTLEPLTPGLAARMVRDASPAAFERCFEAVGIAGWPTASTPTETAVARRLAVAECLRRN